MSTGCGTKLGPDSTKNGNNHSCGCGIRSLITRGDMGSCCHTVRFGIKAIDGRGEMVRKIPSLYYMNTEEFLLFLLGDQARAGYFSRYKFYSPATREVHMDRIFRARLDHTAKQLGTSYEKLHPRLEATWQALKPQEKVLLIEKAK